MSVTKIKNVLAVVLIIGASLFGLRRPSAFLRTFG